MANAAKDFNFALESHRANHPKQIWQKDTRSFGNLEVSIMHAVEYPAVLCTHLLRSSRARTVRGPYGTILHKLKLENKDPKYRLAQRHQGCEHGGSIGKVMA
jgi:hypothetical protein